MKGILSKLATVRDFISINVFIHINGFNETFDKIDPEECAETSK
jgi:hypothetical protein